MAEKRGASLWAYVRWALMGLFAVVVLGMGALSVPPTSAAPPDRLPPLRQLQPVPSPVPLEACPPGELPYKAPINFNPSIYNDYPNVARGQTYSTGVLIASPSRLVVDATVYVKIFHPLSRLSFGCQRAAVRTLWFGQTDSSRFEYAVPRDARSGDYYVRVTILSDDRRLTYYESPISDSFRAFTLPPL